MSFFFFECVYISECVCVYFCLSVCRYLLSKGANRDLKTNDGERPLDLCDARDFSIISVMLESDKARKARLLSAPDEELEFCVDDHKQNDNSDDDHGDKLSAKLSTLSDSADSSPETPRRSRLKNDIKNANTYTKSSTSGLVKGMSHLQTVNEDSSPSALSPGSARQRKTATSLSPKSSETAVSRPPKPPGTSILKKSPQQFKTTTE